MHSYKPALLLLAALVFSAPAAGAHKTSPKISAAEKAKVDRAPALLWRAHANVAQLDLFYGLGGEKDQPRGPFTFEKEDLKGSSPKFVVRDADGVKWKVKLGPEAQPEVPASRLVWAAGYFANEDYLVPVLRVENMPEHLHRGQKLVSADGSMVNARLKRYLKDEEKAENWKWARNPFEGTREFNGLRVMMALVNNWDLKTINNGVFADTEEPGALRRDFMVNDLGSTFASPRRSWPVAKDKGNLAAYRRSRFIRHLTPDSVDFYAPGRPSFKILVVPKEYFSRIRMEWIGKDIPREDARWLGELLAGLTHEQICDAFRAGGYGPGEIEGFAQVVENRIAQLRDL